jgi:hypothetical protein
MAFPKSHNILLKPCLMKDQVWSENSLSIYDLFSYYLLKLGYKSHFYGEFVAILSVVD